ncbi:hypothetical protein ACMYYO_00155 [Dermacoccaceae bacterium W4C1]
MDTRYLAYVDADPDFYCCAWEEVDDSDLLGADVDLGDAQVRRHGPYRILLTGPLPPTGWKVHVSATPQDCRSTVAKAIAACLAEGISCKHLLTERLVTSTQAKYADLTSSGKVLTAYPVDDAALERLLARLRVVLRGHRGSRVLSDIPIGEVPVSVRHGAFLASWAIGADGRTRPGMLVDGRAQADDRSAHNCRAREDEPQVVADLREQARIRDAESQLDIRDVRLLHRSNAGGVYAATWANGAAVVLKEARHHAGYDRSGSDAAARTAHERRALHRLSGSGIAPEPVDLLHVGDSDFLVMQRLEGAPLTFGMATRHPSAVAGACSATYRAWVDRVVRQTREALACAHRRGVVHRDLNPGNIFDCGSHVMLIDFESCGIDGLTVGEGVASPLSDPGSASGRDCDFAALERLREVLLNPVHSLTVRRPDLAQEMIAAARADLDGELQPPRTLDTRRLIAGLRLSAMPSRPTGLFPGDIAAFAQPGAEVGLMHGAAGVLHALHVTGHQVPDEWTDWVIEGAATSQLPGLADGSAGIAVVLSELGRRDEAMAVWRDRTRAEQCPWWANGLAGEAVAGAEIAVHRQDSTLLDEALATWRQAMEAAVDHPGRRGGLLHGWAGVGLAALAISDRAAQITGSSLPLDVTAELHAGALLCLERELVEVRQVGTAWMTDDGNRALPYLGHGSAAVGLLAHALLERRGDDLDPQVHARLSATVDGVRHATGLPCVGGVGLLHGRAGILLTHATLAPQDEAAWSRHLSRLHWYSVPPRATSRAGHAAEADLYLGEQNLRASTDLGTGAAGVLLCSAVDAAGLRRRLSEALWLPAQAASGHLSPADMTAVMSSC